MTTQILSPTKQCRQWRLLCLQFFGPYDDVLTYWNGCSYFFGSRKIQPNDDDDSEEGGRNHVDDVTNKAFVAVQFISPQNQPLTIYQELQ